MWVTMQSSLCAHVSTCHTAQVCVCAVVVSADWTLVSRGMDKQTDAGGGHQDMEVEFEVTLPLTTLRHTPCHSMWNIQW